MSAAMSIKETKKTPNVGIIVQIAIFFLIGILTTGTITFIVERRLSNESVTAQAEQLAAAMADEVKQSVTEYPAYEWLLEYWYDNSDKLDIEYDATYVNGTKTEEKCRELSKKYPDIQLKYVDEGQIASMPEEDKKLYAEIAYSWLITHVNQIKRSYHIDYLFCVVTEPPYDSQVFLFSGADEGAVRGTTFSEIYPAGHKVSVAESQQKAMENAIHNSRHLADAGDYVDHYTYMCPLGEKAVMIGLTYNLSSLRADIDATTLRGTRYAMLNQLTLSLISIALILLFVIIPLKKVQKNIRLYRVTKDSANVIKNLEKVRPHNEIGELSEDVSELACEIDDHLEKIRSITAEKERIGAELTLATRIQAAMLPSIFPPFPEKTEFDLYASMDPAKEVGGDFYDFFLVDDDHLCMVIADVSGKGVPAALFMMASKIILANNAMMGKSPSQILTDTNAAICSNNREEMFVTVWLGILEISTGRLTAANAGHEYPAVKSPDGGFELLKDKHGFIIGGMAGAKYKEYELTLEPGSKLFLYTDGVPEATDADGQMFGAERMTDALNADSGASPEQILKNVRAAVDGFVRDAEQFDDLTMLCIEIKERR